jgi:hypothetical protein
MKKDKKSPEFCNSGHESTFEGGGDKPVVYSDFVAPQHFADNYDNKFMGEHTWNAPSAGPATQALVQAWALLQKQAVVMWWPWTAHPMQPSPKTAAKTWRHAQWSFC